MAGRYLKDFTIALVFIMVIVFGFKGYDLYKKVEKLPVDSKYKGMGLDKDLKAKINNIEESIRDRKQFSFDVEKDPLEQNLIVKTKVDLEQEWIKEVESQIRLAATFLDDNGIWYASIAYAGENKIYKIGDSIQGKEIVEIAREKLTFNFRGHKKVLKMAPIPEKPVELSEAKEEQLLNW